MIPAQIPFNPVRTTMTKIKPSESGSVYWIKTGSFAIRFNNSKRTYGAQLTSFVAMTALHADLWRCFAAPDYR
jgi:hypothetical protein